ncbi:MAG: hypothetical protein SFV23_08695 [Planctomycetaceae bacterium]|nr:hypothetical protein [Planctomycetaceae bacterium]
MKCSRPLILLALGLTNIAGCGHQSAPENPSSEHVSKARPTLLPENGPAEADFPELHRLLQVPDRIYSGGEPASEAAFHSLKRLGVKTIVSVDGAIPNIDLAAKHGLRYIHIPIGYDGVPEDAGRALARVTREVNGKIYVHCHHGRHRGPAAAAVACIADGVVTGDEALAILKRAKTGENYSGLWRDVAAYRPPSADAVLPDLVSIARVESLAAAMAKLDRASDHLKLFAANKWASPPQHPDLIAATEAVLLLEGFREAARLQSTDYDSQFQSWMQEAAATAERFESALGKSTAEAELEWQSLQGQCGRCHTMYRD